MKTTAFFITNDVEAAGHRLGFHPTLSIGACVVPRKQTSFEQAREDGLVFYAELQPFSLEHEIAAMKVGCLHLECLEEIRKYDHRYDPTHPEFDPFLVLRLMQDACEKPEVAMRRFGKWIKEVSGENEVEGVTDTVFFDGGHINLCFGLHQEVMSPFGWTGLDLDSLYRGFTQNPAAHLTDLGVVDSREKPHRADHDAHLLAEVARVLLYQEMQW